MTDKPSKPRYPIDESHVVGLKFGDSRDHDTDESLETVLTKGNPPLLSLPFKILLTVGVMMVGNNTKDRISVT